MRERVDDFRGRSAELVALGNGTVRQARAFREAQRLTFPLYTDPSLDAYRQAGLHSGVGRSLHPGVALSGLRALSRGFRQTGVEGHALQLGGAFVIAPGGRLLYQHVNAHAGDHADPGEMLSALEAYAD